MGNRIPLSLGEWYHCYNRGVDKRNIFKLHKDYDRFGALMYLANSEKPAHLSNLKNHDLSSLLASKARDGRPLVEIGAYCLMPNHVHFVIKELQAGGIAAYMQKIFTGYTMYFNKKSDRTGALFAGSFKSKHLNDDQYLKRAVSYVHLNPAELFDSKWKTGSVERSKVEKSLRSYQYSSWDNFSNPKEGHDSILGTEIFSLYDVRPRLPEMITEAQEYYAEIST